MDELTRERYGPLPQRERPRVEDDEAAIAQRRIDLCGTDCLSVADFPVAERRLQRGIRIRRYAA